MASASVASGVAPMASLMDILEPLSAFDASVMLYVGMLSVEYREVAEDFWALRHAAHQKGAYSSGRTVTRALAATVAGTKRKRCHGCGVRWALPWPFEPSISVCSQCTKPGGMPRFQLISATEAFKRFGMEFSELWPIDWFHTSRVPNVIGRSMFLKEDVLVLAMDKLGGPSGVLGAIKTKETKQKEKAGRIFKKKAKIVQDEMEKADKGGTLTLWDVDKAIEYLVDGTPLNAIRSEIKAYIARNGPKGPFH